MMHKIAIVWGILLFLSIASFAALSLRISVKGFGELKDILRTLKSPEGTEAGTETKEG